ncbi:Glycerophosphoryl diester phosphodiesterase [Mycoplasma yeatsii 13926]|uniref:Glycerophosphoryl diester phosphodiesterase n=1 Tax=Mycoplasma yeatsii 13926 TaxID=1188240 RepID=S6G891_9MOLU|nr:glycerophosphodiester phosphodiesterase family protein [Mycoplasma yeatsii]EOA07299.1 Glycerophosphoryl diester phosphodiesterase [Mycoplasma yeatsii 13926]
MILVAHRGFRGLFGENRVFDFENALKITKAVEFDIRLTRDNQVIIFHDHNFKRIGKLNRTVKSMTYDEIKQIPYFKENPLWLPPLFEEFMDQHLNQYEMINVEIKPDNYTKDQLDIVFKSIEKYTNKGVEIIVSSFSPNVLNEILKRKNNNYKTGYLFEKMSQFDIELGKKFDFLHPPISLLKKAKNQELFLKLNIPLNVWTFKKMKDVDRLHSMYKDLINGYISDYPELYPSKNM